MFQDRTQLPWVARISEAFPEFDFERFHLVTLPDLVRLNGHLVSRYLQDLAPIAFTTPDGKSFTWSASASGVTGSPGIGSAGTVVELSHDTFSDHINQLISATGAVQTRRASVTKGSLAHWRECDLGA